MARKMKDSGIEWIGEIPEGWEVAPLKRFASIQTGNTPTKTSDSNYYASTGIPWIKPDNLGYSHSISKTSEYLTSEGALCARIMPPNTVYVCCIGSLGKVGYSSISCACNQQINALIFNDLMFWKYGYYLTIAQESQYLLFGNGNFLQIINSTSQGNIACVLPPLENQHLIACYLDSVCSDIEVLISKTRSSIEEYKKLKQAVITQAVTKGVRGEREMKDSGVEWIGKIPKEWDILNLVAHTSMLTPMRDRPENLDGPIPWIRIEDFDGKYISSSKASLGVSKETVRSMNLKIYPVGTILCTSSCIMGKCAIVSRELVSNQRFIGIIPDQNTCENFLYYLMLSNSERMNYLATGALQANLSRSSFEHLKVQFPSYQEQKEISDYLDTKCAEIEKLIAKKEQLVKELESYKKSLIYEVVTGKREV